MTSVFKNAYDHAQKKVQAVKDVSDQIESLLGTGQEEDEAKALELESALDTAQEEADKAVALYKKLTATNSSEGVAELFVPVSDEAAKQAGESKTMTRKEFENLDADAQLKFIQNSGRVSDKEE